MVQGRPGRVVAALALAVALAVVCVAPPFENVDAFRLGFLQGESACVDLVPGS